VACERVILVYQTRAGTTAGTRGGATGQQAVYELLEGASEDAVPVRLERPLRVVCVYDTNRPKAANYCKPRICRPPDELQSEQVLGDAVGIINAVASSVVLFEDKDQQRSLPGDHAGVQPRQRGRAEDPRDSSCGQQ